MREYRFDVARVVCMIYIVAFMHLYAYIYPEGRNTYFIPACTALTDSCLGLFTFISGCLLGRKYLFGKQGNTDVWTFYRKRVLRIIPLFVIASVVLWLIGFNDLKSTVYGLLCISPVVSPAPRTLWYIPVILWCYLVTPLISRGGMKWRMCSSLCLFAILFVARLLFTSIDNRLVFNMFFYLAGVYLSVCNDWKTTPSYRRAFKVLVILLFVLLIDIGLHLSYMYYTPVVMGIGAVGVFAILFVCEGISQLLFDGQNDQKGRVRAFACQIVSIVSYASMACYMFHRFFYWAAEKIWNPSDTSVKWLFMVCVVFPVIVAFSYMIQKLYDKSVSGFSK